jgi:hypothetical protein
LLAMPLGVVLLWGRSVCSGFSVRSGSGTIDGAVYGLMVSHLPSREAALVGGLDIAASGKFASRAMSPDGPKAKSGDVRFCAAVG